MPSANSVVDTPWRHCAIVVTFEPDPTALLKLISQLDKEGDFLIIDNGSGNIDELAPSLRAYSHCRAIEKLGENIGLALALNRGIDWARSAGYSHVILFDQDSRPGDLFAAGLFAALKRAKSTSGRPIAAVGPRIMNPQSMRQTPFKLFNRLLGRSNRRYHGLSHDFQADFLITSGTLIPLEVLDEVGAMKADYFIDNIDLEWCFRVKARGYDLIGTDSAILYHAIGERSAHPWVRAGLIAQHNPTRTYYSSRNRVHLYGSSYAPLGWKLRDIPRFALKAVWLLLSSSERRAYADNIRRGINDASELSR